jgi:chromate transporter
VFGGGHVVLPLLREAFVTPGWVSDNTFLAGYGAAQAVPGTSVQILLSSSRHKYWV